MTRKRILVPVDFSPSSEAALQYGRNIATRFGDKISCIHVIEILPGGTSLDDEAQRMIRRDAENRLSAMAHSILGGDEGVAFEIIVTRGNAQQKILEKARDLHVRFIVMGRSGVEGEKRLGSNTSQVIAGSPIPVMVFNQRREKAPEQLILPLNVRKSVDRQVEYAIDMANQMGARVSVAGIIEKVAIDHRSRYLEKLEALRPVFKKAGVPCKLQLLMSRMSTPDEIVAFSNRVAPGMILLTTGFEQSIYREVINNSDLPLMCVNISTGPGLSKEEPHLIMNV